MTESAGSINTLAGKIGEAMSHAARTVPIGAPDDTAGDTRAAMMGRTFDSVADIAVCRDGRLVGIVTMEALLAADEGTRLADLMDADPPAVGPHTDQEVASWTMLRHGETSLPVVDAQGQLIGLIPPRRMMSVLFEEHEEDLSRVVGVMATSSEARTASEERVGRRLIHRLPWLAFGLVGAMLSAWFVGAREHQLAETVQLAFFMPAIVYMADAVGTQTETLAVRGLSVGVPLRHFVAKEVVAGTLIGAIVAALFLPFSLWLFADSAVALTVSLALLCSCAVASTVALILPWLLSRLGKDPAFGSGPLATVVQDLLSLVIYLGLAAALVTG
ncbi:magnesium transporter [Mycobacterium sp. CVI_P3]|uniref:Magnesium transporter n=1 Tax=Mycobacterium pinniadriaticum TaxID=2994102 RepID=A0ABT3SHV0_9MYCO|nr:magnesium transporter [Mycobacterium pinniadriaticum]MCX2932013.1 magnesium transporter [Mycobacterium pinniadriaticum]MCX2938437.1 magnesium transporter [Mycobacterium pinniadriaticum]